MRYRFDSFTLDTQRYELSRFGQPIPLEPQVFKVLTYLLQHADRVVPREELFERLWPGQYVSDDALGRCVRQARRALGDRHQTPQFIKTLPRQGYRFIAPVTVAVADASPDDTMQVDSSPPTLVQPAMSSSLLSVSDAGLMPPADEERKQVTVLCGALAELSAANTHLTQEAQYRLLQASYAIFQELVQQVSGTILYLGADGFQALFGAPIAQEDHVRRAVGVALEFQLRLDEVTVEIEPQASSRLLARIGLHTGLVVVGHLGTANQHYTAVGDTTTVASQLRELAPGGCILISESAVRFVDGSVRVEPHGTLTVATLPVPLSVFRVLGLNVSRPMGFGRSTRKLSRFVGRSRELSILRERLELTIDGQGQAVAIAGEPGIGKSRLLYEFQRRLPNTPYRYYEGHCLSYATMTPYLPFLDLVRQICGVTEADSSETVATKVHQYMQLAGMTGDHAASYLLDILGCPIDRTDLDQLSPQARRTRTFDILRQVLQYEGRQQPTVLAIENLHWIDATSEEVLSLVAEHLEGASMLLVATYRSGYRPSWLDKSYATQLALPRLRQQDSLNVVRAVLQTDQLPANLQQTIVQTAGGNPFFLEELAWATVESGTDAALPSVPDSVQAVLAARIDRLSLVEKQLLQSAAVIGHDIPTVLLEALFEGSKTELSQHLAQLQTAEFLYETQGFSGPLYTFKHALTQEVAYGSLLGDRRQKLHAQVAQVLAAQVPETLETRPEIMAHHYTEAGLHEQAIPYWHKAGIKSVERSANAEAIAHLSKGLELLRSLTVTSERVEQELSFYTALGAAQIAAEGYAAPIVVQTYTHARQLCQHLQDPQQLFPVLRGLWNFYFVRADHQTAHELAEQLLPLARRVRDPALLMAAHRALGSTFFCLGHFASALTHLEEGIALYNPEQHRSRAFLYGEDTGVVCLIRAAWALWHLGYPHQALSRLNESLQLGRDIAHPFSLAFALDDAAIVHHHRREPRAVQEQTEEVIALSSEHSFAYWLSFGQIMRGWSLATQGQWEAGHAQLTGGLNDWRATGSGNAGPYFLALLVETHYMAGQFDEGVTGRPREAGG